MGEFLLVEFLKEASTVNTVSELRLFLRNLSSALKADGVILKIGEKRFTTFSRKRPRGEPDYQCDFNVNGIKCFFSVYNPQISNFSVLENLSKIVIMLSSKLFYSSELKRFRRKLFQSDKLWEPFVSSTSIERLVRILPKHIADFLEVDAVALTVTTGEGLNIKGFWSKSGDTEEKLLKTHKRLCIPIGSEDGVTLGYLDIYSKGALMEEDPFVVFVVHKLSACFAVFLDREKLEEKLEYFHLFFRIGNLFRKTSQFRKRVELALWALCYEGGGFGFREAAYFNYDEGEDMLKGFLALSSDMVAKYTEGELPSDMCEFYEIDFCKIPVKREFIEAEPYELERGISGLNFTSPHLYALPLIIEDRILGCFVIGADDLLDQDQTEMLTLFAQEVALAFESAKLQEALKKMVNELKEAKERFSESEKLKTLGEFLARVVHDIKNPLIAVSGLAKRLYNKLPEDYPEKSILKMIVEETNRALSILTDVLSYVRQPVLKKEPFDINELIDEIVFMESTTLRDKRIVLYKNLDRNIPRVYGDSAQIRQVLLNLITNAIQAMDKGGTLIIRTSCVEVGGKKYVKIEVTDTGGGIPPEIVPNIFNPFFTTKSTGTGLGLSTSKKIVELHGGFIECVNNYPVGATFLVYLPVGDGDEKEKS